MEIDILAFSKILLKRWWVVILAAVLTGSVAFAYTQTMVTPKYTSSALMYVYSRDNKGSSGQVTTNELMAAYSLVGTYAEIINSNTVMNQVAEKVNAKLGLNAENGYTAAMIRKEFSTTTKSDTDIFGISITDPNPQTAQLIVSTILDVAPEQIKRVTQAGNIETVDSATLPKEPSSPSIKKNTAIGALLGAFIAIVAFFLNFAFDNRIRTKEDIINIFDMPIIGTIPSIIPLDVAKKGTSR